MKVNARPVDDITIMHFLLNLSISLLLLSVSLLLPFSLSLSPFPAGRTIPPGNLLLRQKSPERLSPRVSFSPDRFGKLFPNMEISRTICADFI